MYAPDLLRRLQYSYLEARNSTMTALRWANYMNITDNGACCIIVVTQTFTGPDSVSYFMNLKLLLRLYDALKSTILKFNTFPKAVIYIWGRQWKKEAHNGFNLEVSEPSGTLRIKSTLRFLLWKRFMPGAMARGAGKGRIPIAPAFERRRVRRRRMMKRRRSLYNPEIPPFLLPLLMRKQGCFSSNKNKGCDLCYTHQ